MSAAIQAQTPARKAPTALEVINAVAHLASFHQGEADDGEMAVRVGRKVVAYLKAHKLSASEAGKLGLTLGPVSRDAAQLRVCSFSHESGGTRGTVDNVVVQWQNAAGELFAYYLPVESYFTTLYPLTAPGRTMYLLLGHEKGSGLCLGYTAYVLELKGNYLILDNQVFSVKDHSNKNELTICNVAMTFNPARQILSLDDAGGPGKADFYSDEPFKPFKLIFRQGRFVRLP
ncbi:hypothetical protein DNI29_08760 [Hymenobacter sediminis]|uniref:hypothetical protein n=1 Tax=Hymenobacter sediminis TaxID=2218621 RepID=UPI000F4EE3A0|nr:hypothetical protein [Hymenobacter sediminis]RPD48692.1 hypothetical protein DNI29_08760 [Hymenobacter sediminis]